MREKINQLKLDTSNLDDKIKYYVAFSFLFVRPLFKSKLLEYFDFDVKRAFYADKNDIIQMAEFYELPIPKDFIEKRDKLNIDECLEVAFSD